MAYSKSYSTHIVIDTLCVLIDTDLLKIGCYEHASEIVTFSLLLK